MITLARKKAPVKTGSQRKKDLQLAIELDEIKREAEFKREQVEHERDAWRKNVAEIDGTAEKIKTVERWRARGRRAIPYVPLMIVNSAALIGQFSWALDHLAVGDPGTFVRIISSVIYAIAVESIALFLQYYANRALKNRDSAGMLYLSAFLVAGMVSLINFSHFHVPDRPLWDFNVQATAYAFALCSLISPWLWRIHSRAEHREALKAAGEIDTRGVKLSLSRKIWHPIKSIKVVSMAAWSGETNPAKAVLDFEAREAAKAAEEITKKAADPVRDEAHKRRVALKNQRQSRRSEVPEGDLTLHPKYAEGRKLYEESKQGPGRALSQRDLAKRLGMKNRVLAAKIIKDVNG
jgi:hypothetical protein